MEVLVLDSNAIHHIMTQRNYDIINYIDEDIGVALPSITHKAFTELQSLVHQLGFYVSVNKLVAPSTYVNCLGIEVDTKNYMVSVSDAKLSEILDLCKLWQGKSSMYQKRTTITTRSIVIYL